ncbi:hypothetical protein PLICRDRAFT_702222 [Plicaturopsis crispa FD-325 SS-3]|uniref:Unplaced genomic scaffold PLICRscaffold_20, whole genome shotgun sequence n=1 Tax=Plicaturopsis crispa FD-325 SS-3 TaxID=944288 RepID=A0A0C9SQN8_PLICR|nr:hypothetical protein PLICRDRAFT_702222 [Plicaturopsis crispa FD-325 SS-3]
MPSFIVSSNANAAASPGECLPSELILRIFELAAKFSTSCCLTLCLVSIWSRCFVTPFLVSTVILKRDVGRIHRFKQLLCHSPHFTGRALSRHVHSLWLSPEAGLHTPSVILPKLDHLVNIALSYECMLSWSRISATFRDGNSSDATRRGRRITLTTTCPADSITNANAELTPEHLAVFETVTHLQLKDHRSLDLRRFVSLTHLAIPWPRRKHHSRFDTNILSVFHEPLDRSLCPYLEFYTILIDWSGFDAPAFSWVENMRKIDSRVHLVYHEPRRLQADWEEEVDGGESVWQRAERQTRQWEETSRICSSPWVIASVKQRTGSNFM